MSLALLTPSGQLLLFQGHNKQMGGGDPPSDKWRYEMEELKAKIVSIQGKARLMEVKALAQEAIDLIDKMSKKPVEKPVEKPVKKKKK